MTDAELASSGRRLYEQILAIPFSHEEMLAFGQAVFSKTPWGVLSPAGKIAMFRLTAALAPPSASDPSRVVDAAFPVTEVTEDTTDDLAAPKEVDQKDASTDENPSACDDSGTSKG